MSDNRTAPRFSSALVTGATGFLGGHLCARLVSCGIRTSSLVRTTSSDLAVTQLKKDTSVISTDGSAKGMTEALAHAKPDVVFHLAAKYIAQHRPEDIPTLISDNVEMTAKLCEATRQLRLQGAHFSRDRLATCRQSVGRSHTFSKHVVCGNQASSGRDDRLLYPHNGTACDHTQNL